MIISCRESDYSRFHGTDYAKLAKLRRDLEIKKQALMREGPADSADEYDTPGAKVFKTELWQFLDSAASYIPLEPLACWKR